MAQYSDRHGGVGAPVGLTVFKTAGGSLGAVPGGFDSHTPLPKNDVYECVPVFLPMVLQVLQNYASFMTLQNYASLVLPTKIHLTFPRIRAGIQLGIARSIINTEFFVW